ncbi:MAG: hypothetical protein COX65_06985 [Elusimicrobia bacterium CG_4_10_14_0_2_um_filter_56_8]|nr:MAG: hypothetical protein AUJ51_03835 [Elusimicrobia bacterium CG1_02_56_21]PJA13534.1 MAG: hypothetical protein COX65_06985 [Elusimicrobia bacterium CG_4_10_14_0_2_um_filter_56_8]
MQTIKDTIVLKNGDLKFMDIMPGVVRAYAWGETNGIHGNFTRLRAGYRSPMHTHTYDVKIVVITGMLLHGDSGGKITRLGPGSFCFIPEGMKHTTACVDDSDCLFYEEQPGRFDMMPIA